MRRSLLVAALVLAATALALPAAADRPNDCITIADFAGAPVGAFPDGWRVRRNAGQAVYKIFDEGARRFLRAHADGVGIQAAVQREWDLDAYPVLSWSWRPRVFPSGANEQSGKNDSALAVYLLVPYSRVRGPKAVKYVWSEQVPAGTRLESNFGLTQVKVLRTGSDAGDTWVRERVNVRDDFRALFGVDQSPTPAGIAVLTDADDTASRAEGDYADFRACRS
jgi:hypothetical protein